MSLGLDLAASRAKITRAVEHLGTLNREVRASLHKREPITLVSHFDPETGWLSVSARAEPRELSLSVILGEFIHDLRSALDYIVAALVVAGKVQLTVVHQFPIYLDAEKFLKRVGTADRPDGPLQGIRHGFAEIERLQPYHVKPDPSQSALALLQRLSNSDKHRVILPYVPLPVRHDLRLHHSGVIVEQWNPPSEFTWEMSGEVEILRVRFAKPYPPQVTPEASMDFDLSFIDAAFPPDYPEALSFTVENLGEVGTQVFMIVKVFEAL